MEEIYSYYKENIDAYTRRLGNLKKKIHLMGSIRLALVAGAILSLWIFRDESWQCLTGITFAYIIPFALLMWYHNKMYARKVYAETLIKLNEDELKGLDYDFSAFDGAADKISGEHSFCLDLDVFGDRSLFQSLNRTVTGFGRERLAGWLSNPLTDKKEIVKRQEAVKELATLSALRQHFYVTGIIRQDTQDTRDNDINFMDRLTQRKHKFVDSLPWKLLIWAVPVLWIVLGIAYSLDWISGSLLNIYFLITLVIAYGRAKEINALYATVNKMESIFNRYSKLMQCVEEDNFQSEELKEISGQLANEKELASHAIKRLSSYIGGLDQRFSLAGIIFNLFYLRDTRHAILLERWIQTYSDSPSAQGIRAARPALFVAREALLARRDIYEDMGHRGGRGRPHHRRAHPQTAPEDRRRKDRHRQGRGLQIRTVTPGDARTAKTWTEPANTAASSSRLAATC